MRVARACCIYRQYKNTGSHAQIFTVRNTIPQKFAENTAVDFHSLLQIRQCLFLQTNTRMQSTETKESGVLYCANIVAQAV